MEAIETEQGFSSEWKYYWSKPSFRNQFIIFVLILASFMVVFPYFFDFIQARRGKLLNDPVLEMLPAINVSIPVFSLLYFAVISWLILSIRNPKILLNGMQTYAMVTILRMISIPLFPLEPPIDYIPLREPFVQLFTHGGRIISRDLFFSGHMTTILFCYYTTQKGIFKKIYLALAFIIGLLLMVQRVHYTIDILAAPLFTWLCFLFSKKVLLAKI
jgi:PAP2 superfamily C-terminal